MSQFSLLIMLLSSLLFPSRVNLQSENAVVHAVLFYSPSCGHCQYVIQEVLPPLFEKYGDKLQIIGIDASQPSASDLYMATLKEFNLERGGVPALIVGDHLLIGSIDIPEKFPGLIEQYLAQGGVDWPDIPGMVEILSTFESTQPAATLPVPDQPVPDAKPTDPDSEIIPTTTPQIVTTPTATAVDFLLTNHSDMSIKARLARDPLGNTLAIVVLVGMLASLVALFLHYSRNPGKTSVNDFSWLIPLLCVVGLGVAGYLAYVETTQIEAVCGPIGDCNTVQQSEYARLFGFLPIGVLGMLGFIAMGIAWALSHLRNDPIANLASLMLFLMSLFGVLFSIYLTFLEPFVIGATCVWCLTSAILMTALMWLTADNGFKAWNQLRGKVLPRRTSRADRRT